MRLPEAGSTGGKERKQSDYVARLEGAGFTFEGVRRLSTLPSVVVGLVR